MFHRVKSEIPEGDRQENQVPQTGVYKKEQPARRPYSAMREQEEEFEQRQETSDREVLSTSDSLEEDENEDSQQKIETIQTTQTGYRRMTQHTDLSTHSHRPSFGPTSSYIPPQGPDTIATSGDRCLTIGRGINMSGEIESCDHLVVEGTVEAALKGAKLLEVAESGVFYGTVEIEEATIAGRFEGDITVSGRLTLHATAVITGSIAYRELEVEAGAIIDGRMTPMKKAVDEKAVDKYRAGSEASAMAKTPAPRAKKQHVANNESGLFTKVNTQY
ncbi:MAG: polymer-forming cytoskeletal protein [Alphaproteobacteria bacterium]|nr:polymer-forming cytoskeletal protein [Alphaproteobacteria bacterium]